MAGRSPAGDPTEWAWWFYSKCSSDWADLSRVVAQLPVPSLDQKSASDRKGLVVYWLSEEHRSEREMREKSAGSMRSACRDNRFRSSTRFLGEQLTHISHFTSPVPSSTTFPVRATKGCRDNAIGPQGLTPPIPAITHLFPDRPLGVNRSSSGHSS